MDTIRSAIVHSRAPRPELGQLAQASGPEAARSPPPDHYMLQTFFRFDSLVEGIAEVIHLIVKRVLTILWSAVSRLLSKLFMKASIFSVSLFVCFCMFPFSK